MGTYRLILALMVLLSHTLVTWWGYNPGVVAVISFFVISGFAMAATIRKSFATADKIGAFYVDRLLRLFPQYLFYLAITAALFYAGMIASDVFLRDMGLRRALMNIPIVPLGIPRSTGFDMGPSSFIPQAWSLALEISFYAAVPILLLLFSQTQRRIVAVLSCLVALLAAMQIIDSRAYGYLTLPGTLFVFMIGMELYERRDRPLLVSLISFGVVLFLLVHAIPAYQGGVTREVVLGIVLAMAIVPVLAALRLPTLLKNVDRYLGDLSYGVFLNHFIFIWLMHRNFQLGNVPFSPEHMTLLVAASICTAAVSLWLVERPVSALRRTLRGSRLMPAGKNFDETQTGEAHVVTSTSGPLVVRN